MADISADGPTETDMAKLRVAFRTSANAPPKKKVGNKDTRKYYTKMKLWRNVWK
jgi:hypothetical protein